mgnify:CR=1 FL=1
MARFRLRCADQITLTIKALARLEYLCHNRTQAPLGHRIRTRSPNPLYTSFLCPVPGFIRAVSGLTLHLASLNTMARGHVGVILTPEATMKLSRMPL